MSSGPYVFLSVEVYCYRQDENIEVLLNHLLLTVCYIEILVYTIKLTAFGPYALNVRTNISSYGPCARLVRV